jgi:hypothetical protein
MLPFTDLLADRPARQRDAFADAIKKLRNREERQ